jgi:hypothetical protein
MTNYLCENGLKNNQYFAVKNIKGVLENIIVIPINAVQKNSVDFRRAFHFRGIRSVLILE